MSLQKWRGWHWSRSKREIVTNSCGWILLSFVIQISEHLPIGSPDWFWLPYLDSRLHFVFIWLHRGFSFLPALLYCLQPLDGNTWNVMKLLHSIPLLSGPYSGWMQYSNAGRIEEVPYIFILGLQYPLIMVSVRASKMEPSWINILYLSFSHQISIQDVFLSLLAFQPIIPVCCVRTNDK